MKIQFLGQGLEPESENAVGNHIIQLLCERRFTSFMGIFAFASDAGINGLSEYFVEAKKNYRRLRLIVGVDQDGTSKEALIAINNLNIESYIFYQREAPIFHPKIYIFEGTDETIIILGSSNMTARGLFANVEGSIRIEFSNSDPEGKQLIDEIHRYYQGFYDLTDPNLFKISENVIDGFVEKGIVPQEALRQRRYSKQPNGRSASVSDKIDIPSRATVKLPREFRRTSKAKVTVDKVAKELEIPAFTNLTPGSIIWQKAKLPSSDAQQVKTGTSITGVIRLSDANFKVNGTKINRNTYFRKHLFGELTWELKQRPHNSPLQIAYGKFEIIIKGRSQGIKTLKISHDPDRISDQNNVPTTIHWGKDMVAYLRKHDVIGKTLTLYAPVEESDVFRIEIN